MLEADRRLSRSLIWQRQRDYFLQNGMTAWQADVVPHAISCSPLLARKYSEIAIAYLRDCLAAGWLDPTEPIYIIELGAGSGRLAYHFLYHFFNQVEDLPIKLILTDFAPSILDAWQQNRYLQEWVEAGVLEFALFDAKLTETQNFASLPTRTKNPIILLANYFFDSIPHDSFVIEDGLLCENLLTLYGVESQDSALFWENLTLAYEAIPTNRPIYPEPRYEQILDEYEHYFPDITFSFPTVGLDCLRFWEQISNGRLLLLSADRGYSLAESVIGQEAPLLNLHGSFSMMVNYHAIGRFFTLNNGLTLQTPHYQNHLQIGAYMFGANEFPETEVAFDRAVVQNDPNDFISLCEVTDFAKMDLPQLLSVLRMSAWDAELFKACYELFAEQVALASPAWFGDVVMGLDEIEGQYLPIGENDTLAEMIGRIRAIIA